jgi:molecular chaperone DnaK (HSP70)
MYKESVQSFLDNTTLLSLLKQNFTQFECYRLGIIDENGNRLKTPVTESEQLAYSSFTRTIIKLKKYLGSKVELMEASNSLEKLTVSLNENIQHYKVFLEYQSKVESIVNELYKTLDEAQQHGIPLEEVKLLLKA